MKITINNSEFNLTSVDLEKLKLTFTFWKGRRFSYQPESGKGFSNIPLNRLLIAIKDASRKPELDQNELTAILKACHILKNKGYERNGQIQKKNVLIRMITKIKHFFAKAKRKQLLQTISRYTLPVKTPLQPTLKEKKRIVNPKPIKDKKNQSQEPPEDIKNVIQPKLIPQEKDKDLEINVKPIAKKKARIENTSDSLQPTKEPTKLTPKEKNPTKSQLIDEKQNHFDCLMPELTNVILNQLDLVNLSTFSRTSQKNFNTVQQNLKNYLPYQTLEAWQEMCACPEAIAKYPLNFAESTAILMQSYPLEVKEALEEVLHQNDQELLMIKILEKCATISPKITFDLLEQAYQIALKSPHIRALPNLARAFAYINPARALEIVDKIDELNIDILKPMTMAAIAASSFLIDPKLSFAIIDKIAQPKYKLKAFKAILKLCPSVSPENAASIIQYVCSQNPDYLKNIESQEEITYYRKDLKYYIAQAYALSNRADKALELIPNIEKDFRNIADDDTRDLSNVYLITSKHPHTLNKDFRTKKHLRTIPLADKYKWDLINIYFDIIKHPHTLDHNQIISICDKIVSLNNSLDSDEILSKLALALIELDVEKAKKTVTNIIDKTLKIRCLVALAKKYTYTDIKISNQLLEEAISLASQIKLSPCRTYGFNIKHSFIIRDATDIRALIYIARHCATFNLEKSKELLNQVETQIKKVGCISSSKVPGVRFEDMDVVPPLAKAYWLINPQHALHLVNKAMANHPYKVHLLLKLSKIEPLHQK